MNVSNIKERVIILWKSTIGSIAGNFKIAVSYSKIFHLIALLQLLRCSAIQLLPCISAKESQPCFTSPDQDTEHAER
jgi:hypothetical protein